MKKVCLIIMDGWGVNPSKQGNAIANASTPILARLVRDYPSTTLETSGHAVGLPDGQMGNSEVGHLTIGAGRVIFQELTRIDKAVRDRELLANETLSLLFKEVLKRDSALHLMGLVSDGGVHSHINHLYAIVEASHKAGLKKIFIHAFLDGRDTPPKSADGFITALEGRLLRPGSPPKARIATVSGRYYAMDRDNRWDRVGKAYDAMARGVGNAASSAMEALNKAYESGETDEFVTPCVIINDGKPIGVISDDDGVMFFNFRADRARQITKAFIAGEGFDGFDRGRRPGLAGFVCMSEYDAKDGAPVVFKPQGFKNILPEVLSLNGLKQFRVSETEKYAHVTFFFNGGKEDAFPGEDRLLIPSASDVPTYDKKPEMRAVEIAEAAVKRLGSNDYSFMLMNFANGDMVGHTGFMEAAVKACETVDQCVGIVVDAALKNGWTTLVTSDHGNAERMMDEATGNPYTAHTTNNVPFMLIDDELKAARLADKRGLQDIAPTILKIMGIGKPVEMSGEALL
ncbi:MAG: 2,3-bisphosphoglycerate-independent phosphoglycerate mutase [Deltaproteobacteria bacterium]|nr:2,3-bisphosphoglycerate-independent phosphoglycerate mutase [Deltaproteobacteria bacterium]